MKTLLTIFCCIFLSCWNLQLKAQGFKTEILGNVGRSNCILIDADTAWLAMESGILKVNMVNHNVKWYNSTNSNTKFRSNNFIKILKDKKGHLWFINAQGQVLKYKDQNFISKNKGSLRFNVSNINDIFFEIDQNGKIYFFKHNEKHAFVPDSLKILVWDTNNISKYNSPEIFYKASYTADSSGIFILSDSSNVRRIKHFDNGIFDTSFPVIRKVIPSTFEYQLYQDKSDLFLTDTIFHYFNTLTYSKNGTVYNIRSFFRYGKSGALIDSVTIPSTNYSIRPTYNPKTNEIYFFSANNNHYYINSSGNLLPTPPIFSTLTDVNTAHFDTLGNLYVLQGNKKPYLSKIDTNGIESRFNLPYPINHTVGFGPNVQAIYDSSLLVSYPNGSGALIFDGISATDLPPVPKNFIVDSTNTIYFLRNDSIIKYKNGTILLKTKLPYNSVNQIQFLYEGGDSLYFFYANKIYAHNIHNGTISLIGNLGYGYLTLSKKRELFFRISSSSLYWIRDSNYVWYALDSTVTGIPNKELKAIRNQLHSNDGTTWFQSDDHLMKRDSNGIWSLYNYLFNYITPVTGNLYGGFYDDFRKCHWLILNGVILKVDSIGIAKYDWENSDIFFDNNAGRLKISNDNKIWIVGYYGGYTKITFDSINSKTNYQKLQVSGNVYHDINSNAIIDSLDTPLPYIKLKDENGNQSYSNLLGKYHFLEPQGPHVIQPVPNSFLALSCDSSSYTFNINTVPIDSLDFALKSIADTLLYASSFSSSQARCSATSSAHIVVRNNGNVKISVLVSFTPDIQSGILSFSHTPDSTNGSTLFWKIDSLKLLESKSIHVSYTVPSVLFNEIKSVVSFFVYDSVNIVPYKTDTLTQTIICSFDPNEKQVSPIGMGSAHYTLFSDTLIYTLLFQNTGNDTAFSVLLIDTLSPHLDIESFNLLSMSHNGEVSIDENRVLRAKFNEINLLWESVNSLASQGYMQFSILPKQSLPEFTLVKNSALIIFDSNPYILTNEVFNTFVTTYPTTAVNQLQKDAGKISIYPNPSKNYFSISFDQTVNSEYEVTLIDISGKILQSWKSNEQNPTFSLESINAGFYLIQVTNKFDFKAIAKFINQ